MLTLSLYFFPVVETEPCTDAVVMSIIETTEVQINL